MTHRERFALATCARQRNRDDRAAALQTAVAGGLLIKQAAHVAGISRRTASRYMARTA